MGIVVEFICKLFLSQLVMDIPGALLRAVFAIILIFMELVGDFTSFWHNQDKDWNFCPYQFQLELQSTALDFLGRAPKEKQFSFISHFTSLTKMTKLIWKIVEKGQQIKHNICLFILTSHTFQHFLFLNLSLCCSNWYEQCVLFMAVHCNLFRVKDKTICDISKTIQHRCAFNIYFGGKPHPY